MAESSNKGAADLIFRNLNIFRLNDSVRDLFSLRPEELEDFVRKYSSIIIFFFSILDPKRAGSLLQKLTAPAIFYLVQEELRLLLFREVSLWDGNLDMLMELTQYLDALENEKGGESLKPEIRPVLEILNNNAARLKLRHFAYLDAIFPGQRRDFILFLVGCNIQASLALTNYTSSAIRREIIDAIAVKRPDAVAYLPLAMLMTRYNDGDLELFLDPEIRHQLPESLLEPLEKLSQAFERFQSFFSKLEILLKTVGVDSRRKTEEQRKVALSEIFRFSKTLNATTRKLFFQDAVRRELMLPGDIDMFNKLINNELI